jgi:hypothetical protein
MSLPPSTQPELVGLAPEPPDSSEIDTDHVGHPEVDHAVERLADLDALPVADHVEVYDDVQRRLAAAMDDTRDRQPPTGSG